MKTTFLGTLIVILTILSSSAFAQRRTPTKAPAVKECEGLTVEVCTEVKASKEILADQQKWYAWNHKFFAPVSINETIPVKTEIVVQKVFNLDERAKVEDSPDAGEHKIVSEGYFKVLAMNKDHSKILVEHVKASLDDMKTRLANIGRRTPGTNRTEATEVYYIDADALKHLSEGQPDNRIY